MEKEKYTYGDVIIDPQDERVKEAIGKKVYARDFPAKTLEDANADRSASSLENIEKYSTAPFIVHGHSYACIIIKKESQVEYVPFDLSKKEDRDFLRGKWIKRKKFESEYSIYNFNLYRGKWTACGNSGKELLEDYTFLDDSPVGVKVEDKGELI